MIKLQAPLPRSIYFLHHKPSIFFAVHRLVTSNFGDFLRFFDWLPNLISALRLVLAIAVFLKAWKSKTKSREPIVLH